MSESSLKVLSIWFDNNSYATLKQKKLLAEQAQISVPQVSKWLATQRAKVKKNQGKRPTHKKLSKGRKNLIKSFNTNIKPDKEEIRKLSEKTGRTAKEISRWFATERFKIKIKNK